MQGGAQLRLKRGADAMIGGIGTKGGAVAGADAMEGFFQEGVFVGQYCLFNGGTGAGDDPVANGGALRNGVTTSGMARSVTSTR